MGRLAAKPQTQFVTVHFRVVEEDGPVGFGLDGPDDGLFARLETVDAVAVIKVVTYRPLQTVVAVRWAQAVERIGIGKVAGEGQT